MTTTDSVTVTGPSPPVSATATTPLTPDVVAALASLLAEAIVADIRQFPNLAELKVKCESTVESPSGLNRRRRSICRLKGSGTGKHPR
jgi:hypothetical protein